MRHALLLAHSTKLPEEDRCLFGFLAVAVRRRGHFSIAEFDLAQGRQRRCALNNQTGYVFGLVRPWSGKMRPGVVSIRTGCG
jgi:hypothetical protein